MGNFITAGLRSLSQRKPQQEPKPKKKGIKLRVVKNGNGIYWVERYEADPGSWCCIPGSMALSEDRARKFIENYVKNEERHIVEELEI